jgi:hypothetical protein
MRKHYPFIVILLFMPMLGFTQVSIAGLESAITQNFNSLASTGTTNEFSTLPAGWIVLETGTNANTTFAAGTGSSNTGNTYSLGLDGDRGLGGLQSGSLVPIIGASFTNLSNATITSLQVSYRGEQWRLGFSARGADRLDFEYSVNATALNNGTWTSVNELDFNSLVTVGTVAALNGNTNSTVVSYEITGLNIPSGATFYFRWLDFNVTNADDALAIDDFSLIAHGISDDQETITFIPGSLNFGDVNIGESKTLQYEVGGSNLTSAITVASNSSLYQISPDGINFSNSIVLSDTGGIVFVKFSPVVNGATTAAIVHESGLTIENLSLSGNGFDQVSDIIPISVARSKSVGTKVTVAGRITVSNEFANPAYLQDATGGLPIFFGPLATGTQIGDSVIVTGPIGLFNDQKQISGSGIFYTEVIAPARILAPKIITVNQMAANEGFLVTINNVTLVNDDFVFYPQSTEQISDATGTVDLRIDGDTNIPGLAKPEETFSVTGVVGRFKTNAQLLPRAAYDIPAAINPSTPADTLSKEKTLDVVNWNFEFFGATAEQYGEEYGPVDEQLQLNNIKRVVDSLNADVVAVQEVSDEVLFSQLASQLGYGYSCSQRYSYSFQGPDNSFPPQKVCFLYDTTVVNVLSTRPLFESRYDSARTIDPSLFPGYPVGSASSFFSSGRLPYLLNAEVTVEGVTEKISFVVLHAKSGSATDDRARRLYDGQVLKDSLDTYFSGKKFIVLGDLNDDLDQSISVGLSSPYQNFVNDTSYFPVSKQLSDAGARSTLSFGDVIDHQILSRTLEEEYIEGSVQIVAPFQWISNYASTTSDHLPVITRYELTAPVANFTVTLLTLSEDSTATEVAVMLSKPAGSAISIPVNIAGTASHDVDFSVSPTTAGQIFVNFNEGESYSSLTLTIANDSIDEVLETIVLSLQTTNGIQLGAEAALNIDLVDNDVPVVVFAETQSSGAEGSGQYFIALPLSTPPATDQQVTISLSFLPNVIYGQDFETTPAPINGLIILSVPAGSTQTGFYIDPKSDKKKDKLPEIVTSSIISTSEGLTVGSPASSFFTIIDVKKNGKFYVYPNPIKDVVNLFNDNEEFNGAVTIELTSDKGIRMLSEHGTFESVSKKLSEKMQRATRGIYYLTISSDDEQYQFRLVKE